MLNEMGRCWDLYSIIITVFMLYPRIPESENKSKNVFLSGLLVNVASAIGRMAEDVETIEQVN